MMKRAVLTIGLVPAFTFASQPTTAAAQAEAPVAEPVTFDLEGATVGPQSVCMPAMTGEGPPVDWRIVEDPTSPAGPLVFAEIAGGDTDDRFPICIFEQIEARNVAVSVRFKSVSGRTDQAAGLMVRARDADNYYVARADALEDSVRFYKVEDGRRGQLAAEDVEIPDGEWQTLGIRIVEDRAEVSLNGAVLFTSQDDTFDQAGSVGIWTKADSLSYFDGLTVDPVPE